MKKSFNTAAASLALLAGSVALATATTLPAAAVTSHAMMQHTWHGTIEKVNAKMGTHESFVLKDGSKTYTVDYTTATKLTMGTPKDIKAGAMMSVTGTLSKGVITATALDL